LVDIFVDKHILLHKISREIGSEKETGKNLALFNERTTTLPLGKTMLAVTFSEANNRW